MSASTPSQSKISVGLMTSARPAAPNSSMCTAIAACTAAEMSRNIDGGSHLSRARASARCFSAERMYATLTPVEMLIFETPAAMNVAKSSAVRPVPPCSTIGRSVSAASSRTRSGSSTGWALYSPCAVPSWGASRSTPVRSATAASVATS